MAAGAGVAPARVVALAAGGRHAVSDGGLRAGNGLPPLVRAAAERDRGSNDRGRVQKRPHGTTLLPSLAATLAWPSRYGYADIRSEEHTSELQSQSNLVCRLLLETKNTNKNL